MATCTFLVNTVTNAEILSPTDAPRDIPAVPFREWVMWVLNYFLWFLWILAVVMIIYAGFRMVISQWEEEDFNKAKTQIIYALIGLVVIILSYSIVRLVSDMWVS